MESTGDRAETAGGRARAAAGRGRGDSGETTRETRLRSERMAEARLRPSTVNVGVSDQVVTPELKALGRARVSDWPTKMRRREGADGGARASLFSQWQGTQKRGVGK
jgi:hypothetical protein